MLSHEPSQQEFTAHSERRGGSGGHPSPPAPFPLPSCHRPTFPTDRTLHSGSPVSCAWSCSLPVQGCRGTGESPHRMLGSQGQRKGRGRHLSSHIPSAEPASSCSSGLLEKGMRMSSLFHPHPGCWRCFMHPAGPTGTGREGAPALGARWSPLGVVPFLKALHP